MKFSSYIDPNKIIEGADLLITIHPPQKDAKYKKDIRIRILDFIAKHGAATVEKLSDKFKVPRPNIQREISLLFSHGILIRERTQGRTFSYELDKEKLSQINNSLKELLK